MSSNAESVERRCSFCGKSQRQVRKIISGPDVCICDGCVGICNEVLAEDEGGAPAGPRARPRATPVGVFTCPRCRTTFALQCETADEA